jgi:hypothetical protein
MINSLVLRAFVRCLDTKLKISEIEAIREYCLAKPHTTEAIKYW